ncbi:MAG: hemolysin III family protein [Anaerolineaceae bacterium]|nr:hemolysin III family protein [Anaerolineaceae bacterium]
MQYKKDPSAPSSTKGEVIANSITHGIGVGLSIAGIVVLIIRAVQEGTPWHLASFIVFGTSLTLLYLASTVYHIFTNRPWKAALQRLDHAAIFFLIAGTYTPFLLIKMRNGWGWSIFGVIWGLSVLGFILKLGFRKKFEKPSVLFYLAMGWFGVVVFLKSMDTINTASLVFLLAGGVAYSTGVSFYRWKSLPYHHAVWHLFVLCGSIFHYFSVLKLVHN